jgi:hypothetical protein
MVTLHAPTLRPGRGAPAPETPAERKMLARGVNLWYGE